MKVSSIGSNEYISHIVDPTPSPKVGKVVRKVPDEYTKSTIKKAEKTEDILFNSRKNTIQARPCLEMPQFNSKNIAGIEQEITQTLAKNGQPNDPNAGEIWILRSYIEAAKTQRESQETSVELNLDKSQRLQATNNKIREEYFKQTDELINQKKTSNTVGWINAGIFGGAAVLSIASLALVIATGGLAGIPIGLAVATGVAGVASGAGTITYAVLEHKNQLTQAALEEKKFHRDITTQKIKESMSEMGESMSEVSRNWSELVKVVNNWVQASLNQ